jgi:hypothetical protein
MTRLLGELVLRKERNADLTDAQAVGREVNAGLVALEHVEAKEEVHRLAFQHRKGDREEEVAQLHLRRVDTTKNLGRPNAFSNACEPLVDQTHDATRLGALWRD